MSNQQIIMALIISIIFIIIASHLNYKRKLRNKIKSEWRKIPKESRLDSEKSLIKSYENLKSYYDTDSHIDDITWYDLDLYAVFQDINHTHSSVGSEAEGVQFDYTLRAGPATSRNAIMLLQTMDFPGNIVQHAQEKANYFDENQVWLDFKEVVEERVH